VRGTNLRVQAPASGNVGIGLGQLTEISCYGYQLSTMTASFQFDFNGHNGPTQPPGCGIPPATPPSHPLSLQWRKDNNSISVRTTPPSHFPTLLANLCIPTRSDFTQTPR
jgi:hypothetical protein